MQNAREKTLEWNRETIHVTSVIATRLRRSSNWWYLLVPVQYQHLAPLVKCSRQRLSKKVTQRLVPWVCCTTDSQGIALPLENVVLLTRCFREILKKLMTFWRCAKASQRNSWEWRGQFPTSFKSPHTNSTKVYLFYQVNKVDFKSTLWCVWRKHTPHALSRKTAQPKQTLNPSDPFHCPVD